jgi:hypothetical protein
MRASLRWKSMLLAGGLWFAPALAAAQNSTEPPPANAPAPNSVGPRELQNFSLPGTARRSSDQSSTPAATVPPAAADSSPAEAAAPAPTTTVRTARTRPVPSAPAIVAAAPPAVAQTTSPSPATAMPPTTAVPAIAPSPSLIAPAVPRTQAPTGSLVSDYALTILPWLMAAIVVAAGTIFLLWRRRPREALARGPQFDLFVPPEPTPAPAPSHAPPQSMPPPSLPLRKPARPVAAGIVATRLRPSLEIAVQPLRCLVEDERVTIEFELELFNAGTAPARAVLAEASLLNASATQDQQLDAFFANPVGGDQRINSIPPLKRISFTSQVVAPRSAIQEYELGGRKAFVPVLAFNALYQWSGGNGQTSAAYVVGRESGGDKLGPLRLGARTREFRDLGSRPLPTVLRT